MKAEKLFNISAFIGMLWIHIALSEIGTIANNPKRLVEIRRRPSDVSWLMGDFAEHIARRSNREDGCTGRFWQGRFDCVDLLDQGLERVGRY